MTNNDIAVVGLAVMGQNLARNIASRGFKVAVYNRSPERTHELVAAHPEADLAPFTELESLVASLKPPRRLLLMVKAGEPVDRMIEQLRPLLDRGDIIIDGGNSFFRDTERRCAALAEHGIHFLGVGISGGEEGALHGPSIMPGGDAEAYAAIDAIMTAIAARAPGGAPCVSYLGPGGAGHYVKMVHNGIEYGDMQLIAEAYDLLHRGAGIDNATLAQVFAEWNQGELQSFLIEITADILGVIDEATGQPLVDLILDTAQQKGTGKWTSQDSFELGVPISTINAAVEARMLSALKAERVAAAQALCGPATRFEGDSRALIESVRAALYASKICAYAQGMALLRAASEERGYHLDPRRSPRSGAPAASSGRASWMMSALRFAGRRICLTCCSIHSLSRRSPRATRHGAKRSSRPSNSASPRLRSARRWPTTTPTAASVCRPISRRRNATISARTPTSGSTGQARSIANGRNWQDDRTGDQRAG